MMETLNFYISLIQVFFFFFNTKIYLGCTILPKCIYKNKKFSCLRYMVCAIKKRTIYNNKNCIGICNNIPLEYIVA